LHLLIAVALIIAMVVVYFGLYFVVPQFAELFSAFGGDLNNLTKFVLSTYRYYFVFEIVGKISFIAYFISVPFIGANKRIFWRLVKANALCLVLIILLVITGLYAPTFTSGSVA
jgi:type II secretory pathway component PulF